MTPEFCGQCGNRFAATDRFCPRCGAKRESGGEAPSPLASAELRPEAPPSPVRNTAGKAALFVGIMSIVPVVLFMCSGFGSGSAKGRLGSRGPSGTFEFRPDGCESMQPFGRAGANVHGKTPNDGGVYITVDPVDGTRVDVEIPGSCKGSDGTDCTVFRIPRSACRTYDVKVEFSGTVINDVRQYEGQTTLECDLPDGTHIEATLEYEGC